MKKILERGVLTKRLRSGIISHVDCRGPRPQGFAGSPGSAGVAKLADAPDLGSGVERRMGSSPFARTNDHRAVVAQLVERHLAKVEVASPSLVYRSTPLKVCGCNSMVEFQPSKLATWVRFPSPAPKLLR